MKKVLLILSIGIPFATVTLLAYYFYRLYSSLSVKYEVVSFSIKNLLKLEVDLRLKVIATNTSSSSITAKDVNVNIYYKEELLATVGLNEVKINSDGETVIDVPVVLKLSPNTGDLITLYTNKQPIPLEIKIKAKLYKIPVKLSTDFTYIKK